MAIVIRAVLDTNILARAARPGTGPAREVLTRVRSEPHCLLVSPFLLNELERVLNYPRVRALHGLSPEEIQTYLEELYRTAEVVHPVVGDPAAAIAQDPDDNPILQTAVLGRANILCTLDRHFQHPEVQAYCAAHGIRILTDVELLRLLREAETPSADEPPRAS
jgi:putative PIN family toxin of toxin-antitoxin system